MKKTLSILILLVIVVLIITKVEDKKQGSDEPIRIGIATVLSGDFSAAGENMVNATRMAIDKVNEEGGINGRILELYVEDGGWESADGLNASQKLINVEGVRYIVAGMSSNGTIASAPLANEKEAILMTPVTGGSNVDSGGEYVFRTANSDLLAGRDLAEAMIELGYTKVASVAEVTEYSLDIQQTFDKTITDLGGELLVSEQFTSDTGDYRTIVSKLIDAKPEALLVASQTGVSGAQIIKQAKELGLKTVIFSDFTFVTNPNAQAVVGSFDGYYFADPAYDGDDPATVQFFKDYEERYNTPSLIPFHAASSYDIVMMFADALREEGDDSKAVKNWLLKNVKNRKGLMGEFSLDSEGNSDLGFVIKKVEGGNFVRVEL